MRIGSPQTMQSLELLGAVAAAGGRQAGRHLYRALLGAIAFEVDATYCRLLLVSDSGWVSLPASDGRRPPLPTRQRAIRLETLDQVRLALDGARLVTLQLDGSERGSTEHAWLFSARTQRGLIAPFAIGASGRGALIIGEERATRGGAALQPERTDLIQLLARHTGEILGQQRSARARLLAERANERKRIQRLERARLSRQLHDSVAQSLNALLVRIRLAIAKGESGTADLRLMELSAREALDSARSLAYETRRPGVDALEAARIRIESIAADAGSSLSWIDQRSDRRLPAAAAEALAAAIKESVVNAGHHGRAETITVELGNDERTVRATISDNGIGFVPDTVTLTPDGRGLGLLGISERLEAVGGRVEISSAPGEGASVALQVSARPVTRRRPPGREILLPAVS